MVGSLGIFAVSRGWLGSLAKHWDGSNNTIVSAYSSFILGLLLRGPMGLL